MGIPERTAIYENCGHSHPALSRRSPSSPLSPARSEPQPPPPQQQQQHHQQQQQQFDRVPPPPYPGHSKQVFSNMPGFRQSYSGSDTSTDMSLSSTENLASWPRQEPQGEETTPTSLPHPSSLEEGSYSVLTRLQGLSPNGSMERLSASPVYAPCSSSFSSSGHSQSASATSTSSGGEDLSSSGGGSRPVQQRLTVPPHAWRVTSEVPPPHSGRYFRSLTPTYHHPHPYVNQDWTVGEGGVASDVYGQSSHVVTYVPFLPPPPEYPGHRKEGGQPCERKVGQGRCLSDPVRSFDGGVYGGAHKDSGVSSAGLAGSYVASDTIFTALKPGSPRGPGSSQDSADHMVNELNEENRRLQEDLVQSYKKISKLQKLEQEMQQVHVAYQSLVRSTEKRERLEAAIKTRLQEEVKKLQTQNEELKAQVQKAGSASRKLRSRSEGRGTQREKESVENLRQLLSEKHTKVEQLEFEVEQWEQRYRDLQALQYAREAAESSWCDCTSVMAVNSQEVAQRLEEESQHDKVQAAEELNQSQRRITELETKVSWLQSQLSQKEHAMKALNHLSQSLPEVSNLPETCPPHPRSASSSSSCPHSMGDSSGAQSCCGPSPPPCLPQGGQSTVQLWQV